MKTPRSPSVSKAIGTPLQDPGHEDSGSDPRTQRTGPHGGSSAVISTCGVQSRKEEKGLGGHREVISVIPMEDTLACLSAFVTKTKGPGRSCQEGRRLVVPDQGAPRNPALDEG